MKNSFFIGDLKEQVGELTSIGSYHFHYNSYEIKEIEGELFIVGQGEPGTNKKDRELEGPELLFSLLGLVKNELPEDFGEPELLHDLEGVIFNGDVLKWVEAHGIPYTDETLNEWLNERKIRSNLLHLETIKNDIAWLYALFILWKATIEENENDIEKMKFALMGFEKANSMVKQLEGYDKVSAIMDALTEFINLHTADVNINVHFDQKSKKCRFILRTDSLMNVAYYQFGALMTKPLAENKKKMKTCSSCHSVFWANHANNRYCSNCDRRTVWSRKKTQNNHK